MYLGQGGGGGEGGLAERAGLAVSCSDDRWVTGGWPSRVALAVSVPRGEKLSVEREAL